MKKKNVVIFSVLLIVSVLIYICIPKTKKEEEINKTKPNVNTNGFLTLMLEQDDGTYEESSSSIWPTAGYIYNDILSKCENGGKLIWNNELKTITLKTDKTDKCYVYFDKYTNPIVNNIIITDTAANSISISVSASGGTNSVATYYYSINNGEFTSSTSNTYTFSGLSPESTYTIKVYTTDSNGISSNIFMISATTLNNLITFTFTDYTTNITTTYYAEEEMTWWDFVNSDYNDGSFSINCDKYGLMYNGMVTDIYDTEIEIVAASNYSNHRGNPEPCG